MMYQHEEYRAWEEEYYRRCAHYDCGVYYITTPAGSITCRDGETCKCPSPKRPDGTRKRELKRLCKDRFNIDCSGFLPRQRSGE